MKSGLMAARQLTAGLTQPVYRNTSGDFQIVTVNFCNTGTSVASVAIAIVQGTDPTPLDQDFIEWGTTVIPKASFDRTQIMLGAGSWVVATSNVANVNVQVMGWGNAEFTPDIPATTVPDGLTRLTAGASAAQIRATTGTITDGVYWIKPSPTSPAQQVYCIMDPTWDGGGWMIVANNSAVSPVFSSAHIPRLTGRAAYVGSSGANSYTSSNNFSINVLGMPISQIAWCAFASNDWKNIYTYSYGTFNTPTYIPDSQVYTRVFDNYHQTLPWLSGFDVRVRPLWNAIPTNDNTAFSVIALYNGNIGSQINTGGSYYPVQVLSKNNLSTTYPLTSNNSNNFGMTGDLSWADSATVNGATTNISGWDDYQDGNGLSDTWGVASGVNYGRGLPSYIMVR
jgi:hypothetical protein